jgi:hypothetical protein
LNAQANDEIKRTAQGSRGERGHPISASPAPAAPAVPPSGRTRRRPLLSTDEAHLRACATEPRAPKPIIRVTVSAAYLHCTKSFLRSRLWSDAARVERTVLPTAGQMISEQTGGPPRRASRWSGVTRRTCEVRAAGWRQEFGRPVAVELPFAPARVPIGGPAVQGTRRQHHAGLEADAGHGGAVTLVQRFGSACAPTS